MSSKYGTTVEALGQEATESDVQWFDALVDTVLIKHPDWDQQVAIDHVWNNGAWAGSGCFYCAFCREPRTPRCIPECDNHVDGSTYVFSATYEVKP